MSPGGVTDVQNLTEYDHSHYFTRYILSPASPKHAVDPGKLSQEGHLRHLLGSHLRQV